MGDWIYARAFPWVPELTELPAEVGDGTEYPADTGDVCTWDLYWTPRVLTMSYQYEFADATAGSDSAVGDFRCDRALQLARGKNARVAGLFEAPPDLHRVEVEYILYPESKRITDTEEHYLKQICFGEFSIASSLDRFTTAGGGTQVGILTVVSNPGTPAVFTIPIYRTGPNLLITSMDVQIARTNWLPAEL